MGKNHQSYQGIYQKDPGTGRYIIETALDQYSDVFNEWDPAPFKQRDLDPELLSYILACSSDIPLKQPVALDFVLPGGLKNDAHEARVQAGIKTFFTLNIDYTTGELRNASKRALAYVVTAFIFLLSAFLLQPLFEKQVFLNILLEGLFIGGWVFLWEAMATFFFRNRSTRRKLRELKRLYHAPVRFKYG